MGKRLLASVSTVPRHESCKQSPCLKQGGNLFPLQDACLLEIRVKDHFPVSLSLGYRETGKCFLPYKTRGQTAFLPKAFPSPSGKCFFYGKTPIYTPQLINFLDHKSLYLNPPALLSLTNISPQSASTCLQSLSLPGGLPFQAF